MLFYSFEFMYLFLPISVIGYYLIGSNKRSLGVKWIVLCSLFFYGWWNPVYILFLVGSILFNFHFGLLLRDLKNKWCLFFSIGMNIGFIGYFKYAGFLVSIANDLSGQSLVLKNIVLPLGISFFTFQQISWLIDNYSGKIDIKDKGFWEYAQFVTFFPQLIAGPIVHHSEMMPQFHIDLNRFINWQNISAGLSFFVIGLAKKVIVADMVAPYANMVFDGVKNGLTLMWLDAWIGALAYTVQIYFDFSGYADMAIGLALMFNIHLPINFNSPYKSKSIAEFWRCWHMTLGRFLRDYVYIPLGGSRCSWTRGSYNLFMTMFLCGIWHGAGWTFILWGTVHGGYLILHRVWTRFSQAQLPRFLSIGLTFTGVVFAWVLFRAQSIQEASLIIMAMAGLSPHESTALFSVMNTELINGLAVIVPALLIAFLLPNSQTLMGCVLKGIQPLKSGDRKKKEIIWSWDTNVWWAGYMVVLCLASIYCLIDQSNVQEFIYFQF